MKYWIVWNYGRCNDGDHYNGIEGFATVDEAMKKRDDLLKECSEAQITLIYGEECLSPVPSGEKKGHDVS